MDEQFLANVIGGCYLTLRSLMPPDAGAARRDDDPMTPSPTAMLQICDKDPVVVPGNPGFDRRSPGKAAILPVSRPQARRPDGNSKYLALGSPHFPPLDMALPRLAAFGFIALAP
jgi:hypothetical protein